METAQALQRQLQRLCYGMEMPADGQAYLNVDSSDTVSFLRPLARRAANTLRPLAVDILRRKPCLLILFRRDGWNVLFIAIAVSFLFCNLRSLRSANV